MRNALLGATFAAMAMGCWTKTESIRFPVTEPDGKVVEVRKYWGFTVANDRARDEAFTLMQHGKIDEARDVLKASVAKDPKKPYNHYDLAIVYEVKGEWALALESINAALGASTTSASNDTFTEEKKFIERHLPAPAK